MPDQDVTFDIEGEEDYESDPAFMAAVEDAEARTTLLIELTALRKAAGLTQTDVARAMGTTQSAISALEGGSKDPYLSTLQRYARAISAKLSVAVSPPQITRSSSRHLWIVPNGRYEKAGVTTTPMAPDVAIKSVAWAKGRSLSSFRQVSA